MSFTEIMQLDTAAIFFSDFAEGDAESVYTTSAGATVSTRVVCDSDLQQEIEASEEMSFDIRVVHVSRSAVTTVTCDQDNRKRDTIVFPNDARTWYVRKILGSDAGTWQLLVADSELPFVD